ncbi:MAG TPA: FkbM family methyltransferase [Acetobacteraceae bacterium]|nr:FkbM family methyltransferase [Acetobacteraceae bacterium]
MGLITKRGHSPRALAIAAVRELARRWGLEIRRLRARNGEAVDLSSFLVDCAFRAHGPAAVIQIGANDGIMHDRLRAALTKHNATALLVEPLPDIYERLVANYRGYPNVRCENVAVSTRAGEAVIYRIAPDAPDMPDWIQGTASFDRSVLLKHRHAPGVPAARYESLIQEVRVPVVTMGQLLQRHPDLSKYTSLHVDTEGHDYEVVKSAVEAGLRPPLISYEHKHLSHATQVECRNLLSSLGYQFIDTDEDTFAVQDTV